MFVPSNAIAVGALPRMGAGFTAAGAPDGHDSRVTLEPLELVTHMVAPSNAIPMGMVMLPPPVSQLLICAEEGVSLSTPLTSSKVTHMVAPSNANACGLGNPAELICSYEAGDHTSTALLNSATQMFAPSNAIPSGLVVVP